MVSSPKGEAGLWKKLHNRAFVDNVLLRLFSFLKKCSTIKDMLAVIKTGGKQYLVSPGQKIKIEKINNKEGEEITFGDVLFLEKGKKIEIGNPLIKGAKVIGKIIGHGKWKKVIVFKYKPKTRYKVKKGHRQPFTEVEIVKIDY